MMLRGLLVLAVIAALSSTLSGQARPLTVAAASDLQGVLPEVAAQFESHTGRRVRLTYGSSGNFFAQIQNGAPFDVFLSADIDYPRKLAGAGLAEPGTLYQYASGEIVLWTMKNSGVSLAVGLQTLLSPSVRKVAIANPEHAPYGRAAVAALKHAGLYERLRPKLVLGENISQAAQFVQSGNAEVGIIARSIALMPALAAAGISTPIPRSSYPPIDQAGIVIKASDQKTAAAEFLAFLKTPAIVELLRRFGFDAMTVPTR